jgi:hypothetical protein
MSHGYVKGQPAGFTNRIERVAIVGVSQLHLFTIPFGANNKTNAYSRLAAK